MTSLLMVFAHPRRDSFCGAVFDSITQSARSAGALVVEQDLYRDDFDPVLTARESLSVSDSAEGAPAVPESDPLVAKYQEELLAADALAVVHPNWWGKPPAILSGWLDRVLAPGVAYKLEGGPAGTPAPRLSLDALIVTTGDTEPGREDREFGDPLALIWERCVLPYIGARHWARAHISPVSAASSTQRQAALTEIAELTALLMNQPERLVSRRLPDLQGGPEIS